MRVGERKRRKKNYFKEIRSVRDTQIERNSWSKIRHTERKQIVLESQK
jgi:hypothetical protein